MVMTRMPPMRALVGVPPQSGKPGLRLAAALRTARGRGARSVRRTRRLRAGQCSAKSVWTAVLEGAAAGGNDLWRGDVVRRGACGARWCCGGAGRAVGGSVATIVHLALTSRKLLFSSAQAGELPVEIAMLLPVCLLRGRCNT